MKGLLPLKAFPLSQKWQLVLGVLIHLSKKKISKKKML